MPLPLLCELLNHINKKTCVKGTFCIIFPLYRCRIVVFLQEFIILYWEDSLEESMATHSVFLPGKSHGQSSLEGYSPYGRRIRHDWSELTHTQVCHSFPSKWKASFNFMASDIVHNDSGAQENKICHCFHFFPIYFPWSYGTGCHDLSFLNIEF